MREAYTIGLYVHQKTIAFCVKTAAGKLVREGTVAANRSGLLSWVKATTARCVHAQGPADVIDITPFRAQKPGAESAEAGETAPQEATPDKAAEEI